MIATIPSSESLIRCAIVALVSISLAACSSIPGMESKPASAPADGQAGCEKLPMSNNQKLAAGAAIGAVAGALVGGAVKSKNRGRNAVVGALGGALVGALASSAFKNEIDVEEQPDGSVKLKIPGSVMFASGQSSLSPAFQSTLTSVTSTTKKYCGLTVRVVGHTDSVGAPASNQTLSENRARSVVSFMQNRGLERSRMVFEGRGQNEPVASNADEAGRQENRRVEIFVKPPAS